MIEFDRLILKSDIVGTNDIIIEGLVYTPTAFLVLIFCLKAQGADAAFQVLRQALIIRDVIFHCELI